MDRFQDSAGGRLLALAIALPLTTGALGNWSSHGFGMTAVVVSILVAILLSIMAVGLSLEKHMMQALNALVVLPPALLAYVAMVGVIGNLLAVRALLGVGAVVLFGIASKGLVSRVHLAAPRRATTHSA